MAGATGLVLALTFGSWLTARAVDDQVRTVPGPSGSGGSGIVTPEPSSAPSPSGSPSQSPSPSSPSPSASPSPSPSPQGPDGTVVAFDPGSTRLSPAAMAALDSVAVYLKQHRDAVATVVGLPDPQGPGAAPLVAATRSVAAANYVVTRTVPAAQVARTTSPTALPARGRSTTGVVVLIGRVG